MLIFSEVATRLRTHPTILPIGEPTPWEVRRTRIPLSKSPHTTMLPGHRGIVDKAKHKKHIKTPLSTKHTSREGHVTDSINR